MQLMVGLSSILTICHKSETVRMKFKVHFLLKKDRNYELQSRPPEIRRTRKSIKR